MAVILTPTWTVDGIALARNPTTWSIKWDKANVKYEKQADGQQLRVQAPKLQTSGDIVLTWQYATRRVLRSILQYCNQVYPLPGQSHTVLIDGIQPPLQFKGWFDTPETVMSKDNFTTRPGEGGSFIDINLTIRMDGKGLQSYYPVSSSQTPLASQTVQQQFGGIIGNYLDCLPVWNGQPWNQPLGSSMTYNISNLGNQTWLPQIVISGPFASCTLAQFIDVDGTGKGIEFNWRGGSVTATQGIAFNMQQMRCYLLASGQLPQELYTFEVNTRSDHQPFGYWPGLLPGNNSFSTSASGLGSTSSIDFSNGQQEHFGYWG